jgi:hypothetical protein
MPLIRSNKRIDGKVAALINDVQAYSKPEGKYPNPPVDTSTAGRPFTDPAAADLSPDHSRPPDWFEPHERKDDGLNDDGNDIPAILDKVEVPPFTQSEERRYRGQALKR